MWFCFFPVIAEAQTSVAAEHSFYYTGNSDFTFVPVVNLTTRKNWHVEGRYNYEDFNTASFHVGKSFTSKGALNYRLTPLVGGLVGKTKGLSLGTNFELEYKRLNWFTQTQYVFSSEDFVYTWSELYFTPKERFYFGAAIQHTAIQGQRPLWEPGLSAGFKIKDLSFTLYDFIGLPQKNQTFILSLIYEGN